MNPASSHEQLRRMVLLVPYVVSHPGVKITDLAAEFSVTEHTIREDLNTLTFCGLPGQGMGDLIEVVYDADRVYVSEAAGIDRPLQLTAHEATALVVALRALQGQSGGVDSEAVTSAIVKVEAAVGDRAGSGRVAALPSSSSPSAAPNLRDALERGRAVELRYYVPTRDELTQRVVDPIRVVRIDGADYLEAWCREVEGLRTFRLDRIEESIVLDEASRPPDVKLRDLTDGVYAPDPQARSVTLELTARGRWVAEYYDVSERHDHPDGSIDLVIPISQPDLLEHIVASLGPEGFREITDPRVREAAADVATRSREALAHYAD